MEEKKAQISKYLRATVTPLLTPLMHEMVKERPSDPLLFARDFLENLLKQRPSCASHSADSSESEEENTQEMDRQFQEKLMKKKGVKKMSRQGISAEVYGKFNKKEVFCPKVIDKDEKTKETIKDLLKKSPLFGNLIDEDIDIVINAMTTEENKSGEQVIKEGQEGEMLFVVGSGEYVCSKVINGVETYLKTYQTGESFGELALMYNAPRAASIKCSCNGVLYGLDRQTFKHVAEEAANKRRQKLKMILEKVSILSEIDPFEKDQLCDILKEENYEIGQTIVRQGEEGDKFYMIAHGDLIAEKDGKKVYEFRQGDYFGQISLVRNTPRQATVRCVSKAQVVCIDRESFKRMFGPIEEILKRNEEKYKQFMCD